MSIKTISIVLAAATLAVSFASASAQTQAQPQTRPAIIPSRSPSPTMRTPAADRQQAQLSRSRPGRSVGTMQNYVTVSTIYNRTPDQVAQRSKYGNETLPWPLEIPGRDSPIFEFETPPVD